MRRFLCLLFLLVFLAGSALADRSVTMTFTGDITLGSEELKRKQPTSFVSYAKSKGFDYFLANFREMFLADDLTVINLEGPLTDSSKQEDRKKTYRFRGSTAYADILTGSGIEAANLANNHCPVDFGKQGYSSTKSTLAAAGIGWFANDKVFIFEKDGIRIAFFGLNSTKVNGSKAWFRKEIPRLKQEEGVNAVVFVFHAGSEYSMHHTKAQETYSQWAIDAGADLVIMHHPHVVQGIDVYKDRYVCYSIGNFCFGGNKEIRAIETVVAQVRMDFDDEGHYLGQAMNLYPAHISGHTDYNDYQPVPVTGEAAQQVMHLIEIDTDIELAPYDDELGYAPQPYLSSGYVPADDLLDLSEPTEEVTDPI